MKHIKDNGGVSIFVGDNIEEIENKEDISVIFKRDYSSASELYNFIKKQIEK